MPEPPSGAPAGVRDDPVPARACRRAALLGALRGRVVRWGFLAVALALGGWAVAGQWAAIRAGLGRLAVPVLPLALLAVLAAAVPAMQVWRVLLTGMGSALPWRAGARVFFVSQLGKYIPGSVWPVLAQMELGREHRVPSRRSATAALLTMVVGLASGLLTALATLPWLGDGGTGGYGWAFLAVPVLLVGLHPRVLNPVLDRVLRLLRRPGLEAPLTGRVVLAAVAWSLLSWLLYGVQIWLLAAGLGAPAGGRAVPLAVGGFAFAWCVGFLVVFAPAGAGVREALLVVMLAPVLGVAGATVLALLSRVLMSLADFLVAGLAAWSARRRGPAPVVHQPAS